MFSNSSGFIFFNSFVVKPIFFKSAYLLDNMSAFTTSFSNRFPLFDLRFNFCASCGSKCFFKYLWYSFLTCFWYSGDAFVRPGCFLRNSFPVLST